MSDPVVDNVLHNRQIHAIGMEAMKRLVTSDVCLIGLSGTGVEIAKNLILSGVRSVTLIDSQVVQWSDLSSTYCARAEHVGKVTRATAYLEELSCLNPTVHLSVEQSYDSTAKTYTAVVVVNAPGTKEATSICTSARNAGAFVVLVESRGLFGRIFVDFGNNFVAESPFANPPLKHLVTNVTSAADGNVVVHVDDSEKKSLGLHGGDLITFEGFSGEAAELNGKRIEVKKTLKAFATLENPGMSFLAHDVAGILHGVTIAQGQAGYIVEIQPPKTMSFQPLDVQRDTPTLVMDLVRDVEVSHNAFEALGRWMDAHGGSIPRPFNNTDAEEIVAIAKTLKPDVAPETATMLSHTAAGDLSPIASYLGGIAAQEVLKAITRKYVPLEQWYYFDARELYNKSLTEADCAKQGNRYDGQVACLGKALQSVLEGLSLFVVGSGALGCEYVKTLALMGACCSKKGLLSITDDDPIERGNLSRQFLFRNEHIGKHKATIAAAAAGKINPAIKFRVLLKKVMQETEDTFDDRFWSKQALIVNALDNIKARLYVDSKCLQFRKILIEAGTTGPLANMLMVVPGHTATYSEGNIDVDTGTIPACTVHFYPSTIEHCIHYAKDLFVGIFRNPANEVNSYLHNREEWVGRLKPATMFPVVSSVHYSHVEMRPKDATDCVRWAREFFEGIFVNNIKQLLFTYPPNTMEKDRPFWSGFRKLPHVISFDPTNVDHITFVRLSAQLFAQSYGIPFENVDVEGIAKSVVLKEFVPRADAVIPKAQDNNDAAPEDQPAPPPPPSDDKRIQAEKMITELQASSTSTMHPIEFEKDDPTNGHIDFLHAVANIRAGCYSIPLADKMTVQRVSGNIIPAMVTTTAMVVGIGALELYKAVLYLGGKCDATIFRNAFLDMAMPFYMITEPTQSSGIDYAPTVPAGHPLHKKQFTVWDQFEIKAPGDISLQDLIEGFENKYNLKIRQLFLVAAKTQIWMYDALNPEHQSRVTWPVGAFAAKLANVPLEELMGLGSITLKISCNAVAADGSVHEVSEKLPFLSYKFKM